MLTSAGRHSLNLEFLHIQETIHSMAFNRYQRMRFINILQKIEITLHVSDSTRAGFSRVSPEHVRGVASLRSIQELKPNW